MQSCIRVCCVTLWSGLKQIGMEKEVPGLRTISWGMKVVKNLDAGGLWRVKDRIVCEYRAYMYVFAYVWPCEFVRPDM